MTRIRTHSDSNHAHLRDQLERQGFHFVEEDFQTLRTDDPLPTDALDDAAALGGVVLPDEGAPDA